MTNNQRLNITNSFQQPLAERQQQTNSNQRETNENRQSGQQHTQQMMGDVVNSQLGHLRLSSNAGDRQVVWGTNIVMMEVSQKLDQFLNWQPDQEQMTMLNKKSERGKNIHTRPSTTNEPVESSEEGQQKHLRAQLESVVTSRQQLLFFDCEALEIFDKVLYAQLLMFPAEIIGLFDTVVTKCWIDEILPAWTDQIDADLRTHLESNNIKTLPVNFKREHVKRMRDLGTRDVQTLVAIRGLVLRTSEVQPEMAQGYFECNICQKSVTRDLVYGKISEPKQCESCRRTNCMELVHNRSMFVDKQLVKIQEAPEDIPEGETALAVIVVAMLENVDAVKPGDRVELTGIQRAVPQRERSEQRISRSVFRTYIDVLSQSKVERGSASNRHQLAYTEECVFTEERVKQLRDISQDPNLQARLLKSFAPSIWENEHVKKGLLCQLFGGCEKNLVEEGSFTSNSKRGEVNCLLVGDPSTAKSQLLKAVSHLAPRGIYTSGKGSSAVGLTASVTTDPETRELVLESGALVLSDRGICCIDEFDKMSESARSILHEAMEQQTVSIAKAGIICTLNARTAVLAAANPVESRQNPNMSIIQNIKLPPALISRFDLIQLMLDGHSSELDWRLSQHIVGMFTRLGLERTSEAREEMADEDMGDMMRDRIVPLDYQTLRDQIALARKQRQPVLTNEAKETLVATQTKMRSTGIVSGTVTATPRQLEALVRLSEAFAKMRLDTNVQPADVNKAQGLVNEALKTAATDPNTGIVDMDMIVTGVTNADRAKAERLRDVLGMVLRANQRTAKNQGIEQRVLFDEAVTKSADVIGRDYEVNPQRFQRVLENLEEDNVISISGSKTNQIIKLINIV